MQLRTERAVFLFTLFLMLSAFAAGQYSGDLTAEITGFATGDSAPSITGYADKDFDAWNFEDADGQTGKTMSIVFHSIGIELWSFIVLFLFVTATSYFAVQSGFSSMLEADGAAFPTLISVGLGLSTSGYYVFWKNFNAFEVFADYGLILVVAVFALSSFSILFGKVEDNDFTKKAGKFGMALFVIGAISFTADISPVVGLASGAGGVICLGIWIYGLVRHFLKGKAGLAAESNEKASYKIKKAEDLLDKHTKKTYQEYRLDKSIDAVVEKILSYAQNEDTFAENKKTSLELVQKARNFVNKELKLLRKQIKKGRKLQNEIAAAISLIRGADAALEKSELKASLEEFQKVLKIDVGVEANLEKIRVELHTLVKVIDASNAKQTQRFCLVILELLKRDPLPERRSVEISKDINKKLHDVEVMDIKNIEQEEEEEAEEESSDKTFKKEAKVVIKDIRFLLGLVANARKNKDASPSTYIKFMQQEARVLDVILSNILKAEGTPAGSPERVEFILSAENYTKTAIATYRKAVASDGMRENPQAKLFLERLTQMSQYEWKMIKEAKEEEDEAN